MSADSHPVGRVIRFTVGGGDPVTTAPVTAATSTTVSTLLDLSEGLQYLGLALAGGAWLLISLRAGVLDSPRGRDVVRGGLILAVVAGVGQLALQGPYTAGTSAGHAFDGPLWRDTLATQPVTVTATFDRSRSARVEVSPAHTGPVAITVTLTGIDTVQSLQLTAALPSAQIGPLPVALKSGNGSGPYRAEGVDLPTVGHWTFTLTRRTSEFDSVVADVAATIR